MVRRALCLWRGGLLETRDEWSPGAKVMLDSALPAADAASACLLCGHVQPTQWITALPTNSMKLVIPLHSIS